VGITFGFNFEVKDMDGFIIDKISKRELKFRVVQERQYASGESHIKELLVR
jgi:hypothetical protein